jgi:hypothetical protein
MGYALTEDTYYSPDGKLLNPSFSAYHIPTVLDIPGKINVDFVEAGFVRGTIWCKGSWRAINSWDSPVNSERHCPCIEAEEGKVWSKQNTINARFPLRGYKEIRVKETIVF